MGPVSIGVEVQRNTDGDTPSNYSTLKQSFCFYLTPLLFKNLEIFLCRELSRLTHGVGGQIAMYQLTTAQPE